MNARVANASDRPLVAPANADAAEQLWTLDVAERNSMDTRTNKFGEELLSLCKERGMLVFNGRVAGDETGRHTFCSEQGESMIDLFVGTPGVRSNPSRS
ncbi:MAG: hypothetical protein ACOVQL_09560, partial [Limnohabitans sp.]